MVSLEGKSLDSKQNGRWTDEEHLLFERALQIYGKKWKKIEAVVGTRTATQIRSHAQKHFIRLKKTTQSDSDHVSSVSEQLDSCDSILDPEEAEKQHLKSCIQYFGHLNSLLEAEIRKYSTLSPTSQPTIEGFTPTGNVFKRVKLEESYQPEVNSANASQV